MCSVAGLGQGLLPGVLWGMAAQVSTTETAGAGVDHDHLAAITPEMIDAAAAIAAVKLTAEQKTMVLEGLKQQRESVLVIRSMKIPNQVAPAFVFDPVPAGMKLETERRPMRMSKAPDAKKLAASASVVGGEGLAFASVRELAELVKTRKVASVELTKMYLARLKRYDPRLHFLITLTEERALKQAADADREIAAGRYRGPLHGIPWGAKDLLAVKGYPTTWGAAGFEQQSFDYDATVVERLDAAGAVLVAKLTMGALAQGDLWFGARTRNPWNPKQGSSGSSAGSASAVSAGCVGFAIGTETLGSISSPSTRCGVTGLRPTFGLVPRTGAMALSWTMDKIGPICRVVEDCALVMSVIYGPDGHDRSVKDAAFNWDADLDWKKLRVGYLKDEFDMPVLEAGASEEKKRDFARDTYDAKYGQAALDALRKMGVKLIEVKMPKGYHFGDITPVLAAEAAAAFDELTLSGRDALLTGQESFDWPNTFRKARFYSAVDYIQAQRARMLAIDGMAKLFREVDVVVTPSNGAQLSGTNLTGNPAVIVPNGVRGTDAPAPDHDGDGDRKNTGGPGTPVSLTFLGALYSDARLAAFARAYQESTGFHRLHPKLD
ncbi:Asp-tRNA(Asn)/Glu-tRNA(Gln) amidotransferase A subunit family amidase [Edaphobacter modestus]|uniref:Asp-tRNA(Asn)/Glu-tRNA(Gln) amidotransferase A subunit family amidase n=1 Tax=Edaphobacter modestus TaxID=388466 RepID=A0A4Q7YV67_9BACT|nr:Asp-tRNA(Asn)/Glu-tRNA(Gln) amidotransferase A subunit family amidase [Edaphobacter modestus]